MSSRTTEDKEEILKRLRENAREYKRKKEHLENERRENERREKERRKKERREKERREKERREEKEREKDLKRLRENDPTLTFLQLSGKIGAAGARKLADALKMNTVLTWLWLDNNNIGDGGAKAIASTLEKNSTITKLYLPYNNIGREGAMAFANVLEKNNTITELWLDGNHIGKEGAMAFANVLEKNNTITKLWLGNNNIGDDGVRALADALKNNTALTKLVLEWNALTVQGAKALADGLESNSTLIELRFDGNSCPFGLQTRIKELLERNKMLRKYDIVDNTDFELVFFGDDEIEEIDEFLKDWAEPLDTEPPADTEPPESPNKRPRVDEGPTVAIGDPNGNENEMEHQNRLPASSNGQSLENDILQTAPRADRKNGGGRKYQFHAGNMRLNQIMITFVEAYQAGSRVEKRLLVLKILARVKEAGGRFLKQQPGGDGKDVWVEQTEEEVRDKISRRFKDFKKKFVALEKEKSNYAVDSLETQMESLAMVDLTGTDSLPKKVKASKRSYLVATFVIGTDPNHPGDVRFRQMVRGRYQDYQKAGWVEKAVIETELCSQWKDAGGRFMKSIENDWWVEQTEEEILSIITSVFTDIEDQMQRTPWQMSEEPDPFVPEEAAWRKIMLAPPL